MRKVILGVLIVCLSLGLATAAMAIPEVNWAADLYFNVTGTSGGASGLFGGGVTITATATQSYGPFDGLIALKYDSDEAATAAVQETATSWWTWWCPNSVNCYTGLPIFIDDAYIKYNAAAFGLYFRPLGVDQGIYDVETATGPGTLGIPCNPGLKLEVPMENFSMYGIVNNQAQDDS